MLEIDLNDSLKVVSERSIEGASMISKQFETEMAKRLEKILADYKKEQLRFLVG